MNVFQSISARLYVPLACLCAVFIITPCCAQYRNGYKIDGVTVAKGSRGMDGGAFVDTKGTVYLFDQQNYTVQRWPPGSKQSEIIARGDLSRGQNNYANVFCRPGGIFADSKGDLFFTEMGFCRALRLVQGAVELIAGFNGCTNGPADLNYPRGIFIDPAGNVYIADAGNDRVQRWAPGAKEGVTVAGGNGRGKAANQLDNPHSVYVSSSGEIYVADSNNDRVQQWMPGAKEGITVAGGNGKGTALNQLNMPTGVFVDASGDIFVSDQNNDRIQFWAPGAKEGGTVAGGNGRGTAANQLYLPASVFADLVGNLYVLDFESSRVQKFEISKTQIIRSYVASKIGNWQQKGEFETTQQYQARVTESERDRKAEEYKAEIIAQLKKREADNIDWKSFTAGNYDADNQVFTINGNDSQYNLSVPIAEAPALKQSWASVQFSSPDFNIDDKGQIILSSFSVTNPAMHKTYQYNSSQPYQPVVINPPPYVRPVVNPNDKPVAPPAINVLAWLDPVADISKLPDGVYHSSVGAMQLQVRITSSAPVDAAKVELLINGARQAPGGKMHVVSLTNMRTPGQGGNKYEYTYHAEASLAKGASKLQVRYGNDATEELNVNYQPQGLHLYVLAIGTDASGLKYPVNDARDFADIFRHQEGDDKLFNEVNVQTLLGADARAISIAQKMQEFGSNNYGPNDVLMVFISSHGFTTSDGNLRITGSDFSTAMRDFTSIDFKDNVQEALAEANCKKFIFLDACHSGAGIKAAAIDVNAAIQKMMTAGNNTTIITSSSAEEQSWEDDAWQNGAFTKAIKDALQGKKADINGDGIVNMDELFAYISKRVPELVKQANKKDYGGHPVAQTPKMYNPKGDVSIYVY